MNSIELKGLENLVRSLQRYPNMCACDICECIVLLEVVMCLNTLPSGEEFKSNFLSEYRSRITALPLLSTMDESIYWKFRACCSMGQVHTQMTLMITKVCNAATVSVLNQIETIICDIARTLPIPPKIYKEIKDARAKWQ